MLVLVFISISSLAIVLERYQSTSEDYNIAFIDAVDQGSEDRVLALLNHDAARIAAKTYSTQFVGIANYWYKDRNQGIVLLLLERDQNRITAEDYNEVFRRIEAYDSTSAVIVLSLLLSYDVDRITYDNYIATLLRAVAFGYQDAVLLLLERSQNRITAEDYNKVIVHIRYSGDATSSAILSLMKRHVDSALYADCLVRSSNTIAKLARDGRIYDLKHITDGIDASLLPTNAARYFFNSTIDSCFKFKDSVEKINIEDVDFNPLTVAQNYCDTLVRMKTGRILKLRGNSATGVYKYLSEELSKGANVGNASAHDKNCKLDGYFNPGHMFFDIKCSESKENIPYRGFYPATGNSMRSDYTAEVTVFLGVGVAMVVIMLLMRAIMPKTKVGSVLSGLPLVAFYYLFDKVIYPNFAMIDHKFGRVSDELHSIRDADNMLLPKVSFIMTEEQAQKVKTYIQLVIADCTNNRADKCTYNFLTRNCIHFTDEVFNAAGFSGAMSSYISQEQLAASTDYSDLYGTKVATYQYLTQTFLPSYVELD